MTVHGRLSAGEVTAITIVDGLVESGSATRLVGELVTTLAAHHPRARLTVLQPATREPGWPAEMAERVEQLAPDLAGDWLVWAGQQLQGAECVWTLGIKAAQKLVEAIPKQALLHALILDEPERDPRFLPGHGSWLAKIGRRASLVWFTDEQIRSTAEAVAPNLCERTRVFSPSLGVPPQITARGRVRLVQPVCCLTSNVAAAFNEIADDLLATLEPLHLELVGTADELAAQAKLLGALPVLPWNPTIDGEAENAVPFALIDDSRCDGLLPGPAMGAAWSAGAAAVPLSRVTPDLLRRALLGTGPEVLDLAVTALPAATAPCLADLLPPTQTRPVGEQVERTRVVLAGSDLKFASPLVSAYAHSPSVELLIDPINKNAPEESAAFADWADVVVCEFMTAGAVWYSQNLPAGKKLIVHLHGFELWAPLTDQVNIDRVDTIVVVSEFYKQTALAHRGWPADKLMVVPNATSESDLDRPKDPDARFQLALVGWVPSLKRPDRALDLLEELLQHDKRYHLTIRGAWPWDYPWEWEKPTHQDSYFEVLERLNGSLELASHVTFVPFGADVGNWLRSVGWMLSTSVRETFHLAPVEGMVSGAVPVVWDREGAEEIFSAEFIVTDHIQAAQRILEINQSEEGYTRAQERARSLASSRYAQSEVEQRWLGLVEGHHVSHKTPDPVFEDELPFIQDSVEYAKLGDFDPAVELLDQNIAQTAKAKGFTKQHELFVRGVQELRFRLLRDGIRAPRRAAHELSNRFLLVQKPDVERAVPADLWGATHSVLIAPAPGEPWAKSFDAKQFSNYAPSIPTLGVQPNWTMRFDRYLEVVSAQLLREAQAASTADIMVDGPLWNVLAALRVARVLGGEVWWDLSQAEPSDWTWLRSGPGLLTDDPAEAMSAFALGSVAGVVVRPGHVPAPLLTMLPPDRLVPRDQLLRLRRPAQQPVPYPQRPIPLKIAALVSDELAANLEAHPELVLERVTTEDLGGLDARTDVCVVDTDQFLGDVTTKDVMAALDRIRGRGVRSVVIESQGSLPFEKLTGFYARADVFAARTPASLETQAARSVQAITQLFELPSDDSPMGQRSLQQLLGVGVEPFLAEGQKAAAPEDGTAVGEIPVSERLTDRVSVIMPAYRADGSMFTALDSVCRQTLAADRIEIVVVLNGPATDLRPQLEQFAQSNPGHRWIIDQSEPGASRARNVALDRATGDYITFLDDDDRWEPNHLAAMLAVAAPDTVVVSEIIDLDGSDKVSRNTASRRRLLYLGTGTHSARSDPGLFATMGARLIHRDLIGNRRFDENLGSGEDIAFLMGLLTNDATQVTGAYEMPERAYLRVHTGDSVSRPEGQTPQWGIHDRLGVLREVWRAAWPDGKPEDNSDYFIRANLADPQTMFIERFLNGHPEHVDEARRVLGQQERPFLEFLAASTLERAPLFADLVGEALYQGAFPSA